VAEEFGVPAEVKVVQAKTASYCVKPIFPLYLLLCLLCPGFDNPNAISALLAQLTHTAHERFATP
jgi:hypothetical protein